MMLYDIIVCGHTDRRNHEAIVANEIRVKDFGGWKLQFVRKFGK